MLKGYAPSITKRTQLSQIKILLLPSVAGHADRRKNKRKQKEIVSMFVHLSECFMQQFQCDFKLQQVPMIVLNNALKSLNNKFTLM